jgi:hypothetical protein
MAAYYGYGILFAGFMRWKISSSFMPFLLVKKDFWLGWVNNVINVAEFTPLLLAVLGVVLVRNTKVQYWVVSMAAGFLMFSVAFTYHIHTHPYYHIQLFPAIGLAMAPTTLIVVRSLMKAAERYWWILIAGVALFTVFVVHQEVLRTLHHERFEGIKVANEIGEAVHHSPHVVYVSYYYGVPLEYYGEFGGAPWPVRIEDEFYRRPGEKDLSVSERIDSFGFIPEYYVITNFDLYERKHSDLKEYLQKDCSLLAEQEHYLIFGSCRNE